MAYVRTVKTASGATAVQIVWSSRRGSRSIEHLGSAHDEGELAALKAAAAERLSAGQAVLDLGVAGPTGTEPLPITSSQMTHLWDGLCAAYRVLGFEAVTKGDNVFRDLVLARIIEPTSKIDAAQGLGEGPEAVDVQALVADAGGKRFDVAVAPRLAGRDEVQPDLPGRPVSHCATGQFGPVVASQHRREGAALAGQAIQFTDQVLTGDAALDHAAQAFAGVLIDDRDDLDRSPIGGDVELEVHRPHPVGRIGDHRVRGGGGAVAFAPAPLRYPQPLFAPKTLNLLVIDDPAFTAGIVIGRSETTTRMVLSVGAQPLP